MMRVALIAVCLAAVAVSATTQPGHSQRCRAASKPGANGGGFCRLPSECGLGHDLIDNACRGNVVCCVPLPAAKGGPACPKAKAAMVVGYDIRSVLVNHCKRVQKQSLATCAQRASNKLAKIRSSINAKACGPSRPAPTRPAAAGPAKKALLMELESGDTPGFINKIADYLVQKASGTTKEEIAAGCNFQTKMNCRAWITDCADSCIGEGMSGCKNCMNTYGGSHPQNAFEQCCPCETVRQFGISSCNY